jgi:hypothetical protein
MNDLLTGDLVRITRDAVLWKLPEIADITDPNGNIAVPRCGMGLLICFQHTGARELSDIEVLILDSKTGKYGWCRREFVERID